MDLYWIGGTGNWSDADNHWRNSTGGTLGYGSEVITNCNFSIAAAWGLNGNWNISGGTANNDGTTYGQLWNASLDASKRYQITFTILNASTYARMGVARVGDGGYFYIPVSSFTNGTYTYTFMSYSVGGWGSNPSFYTQLGGSSFSLDDVSIKLVNQPTSTDSVHFNQNSFSGTSTVTLDTIGYCLDMDWSGITQNVTLLNSVYNLNIYGSLYLWTGLTWTFTSTGYLYLKSTITGNTITTNNISINTNRIYFDGVGGSWTNTDNANFGNTTCYLNSGTWNTSGFTINIGPINGVYGTATFNFDSSIINASWFYNYSQVFGTYTLNLGANGIISYVVRTYNNINLVGDGSNTTIFVGITNCIVNNLTAQNGNGLSPLYIDGNFIVNTLTLSGYSYQKRLLIYSNTLGSQRKITTNSVISQNVDFRDIYLSGVTIFNLSGITGGSGDCGGNSGITFTSAQPQYWHGGTGSWSDSTKWFTGSNGSGLAGRSPLPQDDMIFDQYSFDTSGLTVTMNCPRIGRSLNMSLVDKSVTLTLSNNIECYGSYILSDMITQDSSKIVNLFGRNIFYIDTKGKIINVIIYSGDYTLLSDLVTLGSVNNNGIGTIRLSNYKYKVNGYLNNYSTILYLNTGILEIIGSSGIGIQNIGTLYCNTGLVKINSLGSSNITIGGNKTYYKIWFSGTHTGTFDIIGSNTFSELIIDPGRKVRFTAGTTQTIGKLTALGTSTSPIILSGVTNSNYTLTKSGSTIVEGKYLTIYNSTVTPMNKWYAGTGSIDGGSNSGWLFNTTPTAPISMNMFMYKNYNRVLSDSEVLQTFNATKLRFGLDKNDIVRDGLVLYLDAGYMYPMTGTTWYDLSGNGNNGSITGATYNSGNMGNFIFNGNSYISLPNIMYNFIAYTVSIWFNLSSMMSSEEWLFSQYNFGTGRSIFSIQDGSNCVLRNFISGNFIFGATTIVVGRTYNAVFTRAISGYGYIYLNGILDGSGQINTIPIENTSSLIGGTTVLPSRNINGKISNVQVYNKVLSASEVLQNFNALRGRYM